MRVQIKDPCTANWEKMKISGDGRYCKTCCKTVVDFTEKSTEDIVAYFEANSGQRICGHFKSHQVNIPRPPVRFPLLRFAASCWLVFGAFLFVSCGNANSKNTDRDSTHIGDSAIPHYDTVDSITSNSKKDSQIKIVTDVNGEVDATNLNQSNSGQLSSTTVTPPHAPALPLAPRYTEGNAALQKFIDGNLKYPDDARKNNISGIVAVDFLVKKDGSITNIKVRQGLGHGCDEEAVRLIKSMPKWTPGKQNGLVVDMEYNLAIKFGK